jgi:hypothetical protein
MAHTTTAAIEVIVPLGLLNPKTEFIVQIICDKTIVVGCEQV